MIPTTGNKNQFQIILTKFYLVSNLSMSKLPPVHIDELIEYLKKITGHEFTDMEKFTILELIHFGRSSKKKDGQYYTAPSG